MTAPSEKEVQAELALAFETLTEAEDDLVKRQLRSAVSRGYYAVFHAARAVLWTKGLAPKSHKGVLQQFGQHLVLPGLVDKELGVTLKDAFDERELADYHALTGNFELADVERLVTCARKFVERMERLLEKERPETA